MKLKQSLPHTGEDAEAGPAAYWSDRDAVGRSDGEGGGDGGDSDHENPFLAGVSSPVCSPSPARQGSGARAGNPLPPRDGLSSVFDDVLANSDDAGNGSEDDSGDILPPMAERQRGKSLASGRSPPRGSGGRRVHGMNRRGGGSGSGGASAPSGRATTGGASGARRDWAGRPDRDGLDVIESDEGEDVVDMDAYREKNRLKSQRIEPEAARSLANKKPKHGGNSGKGFALPLVAPGSQ
eukprot:879435-Prorocentrum_minimum.AAC.1